eukprot:6191384-Pleurochrysis_carterae.AAC.1
MRLGSGFLSRAGLDSYASFWRMRCDVRRAGLNLSTGPFTSAACTCANVACMLISRGASCSARSAWCFGTSNERQLALQLVAVAEALVSCWPGAQAITTDFGKKLLREYCEPRRCSWLDVLVQQHASARMRPHPLACMPSTYVACFQCVGLRACPSRAEQPQVIKLVHNVWMRLKLECLFPSERPTRDLSFTPSPCPDLADAQASTRHSSSWTLCASSCALPCKTDAVQRRQSHRAARTTACA